MKRKGRSFWLIWAACLFAVLAVWFGYKAYGILQDYKRGEEDLARIYAVMDRWTETDGEDSKDSAQIAVLESKNGKASSSRNSDSSSSGSRNSDGESSDKESQAAWVRQQALKELKKMNGDLAGWVKIDGTAVDYPVMHTPQEPEFYLTHGFDKSVSAYGMIFMDGTCSPDMERRNYILYGHHMKNGAMFAELENYSSREYRDEHPVIEFDTLNEPGRYEIAAAFKLPAAQLDTGLAGWLAAVTEEDYEKLIQYARDHGFYDTGVMPQWPEKLLTLVTCEYTEENGRFFVIARRIETLPQTQ